MTSSFCFVGVITASNLFPLFLHCKILLPSVNAIFNVEKVKLIYYMFLDFYVTAHLNAYLNEFFNSAASICFSTELSRLVLNHTITLKSYIKK